MSVAFPRCFRPRPNYFWRGKFFLFWIGIAACSSPILLACECFITRLGQVRATSELLQRQAPPIVSAHPATATNHRRTRSPDARKQSNVMADFTPISAAIGGALIGLSALLLMLLNGRVAGITGVFAGLIDPVGTDRAWRATFIAGLIIAPLSAALVGFTLPMPQMPASLVVVVAAGLLVGFGTRLGNGCTSGHGVCGIARLSPRSMVATAIFMAAAIVVVALTRHVFGG
jgi:uncharacterized protein